MAGHNNDLKELNKNSNSEDDKTVLKQKLCWMDIQLYNRLEPFVLNLEELKKNDYPLDSPDNPGKVFFKSYYHGAPPPEHPDIHICARCTKKFKISEDRKQTCYYHSGKKVQHGNMVYRIYSCCGNPNRTIGCTSAKQHVSKYVCFDDVKFVKACENSHDTNNNIYALDCEMCYTTKGLEVAKISIVDTNGSVIYDSYVVPHNEIVDYGTEYSGITSDHLKDVKTKLEDVQEFILKLLTPKTILIGHSLENDLKVLHLIHTTIIDTSFVFLPANSRKLSLKVLAEKFLRKSVQQGFNGHDSVEDARTCMELMLYKIQSDATPSSTTP